MALIDLFLNLAAVLLWVNWRLSGLSSRPAPLTLAAAVRGADASSPRRWLALAAIPALLLVRAFFYWKLGPPMHWTPKLPLGAIVLAFRADLPLHALLYSVLSFLLALFACGSCLLLLTALHRRAAAQEPWPRILRALVGAPARWPSAVQLALSFVLAALAWLAVAPVCERLSLIPSGRPAVQAVGQGLVLALGVPLAWKWLVVGLCALHLLNSYVYFGSAAFWNFIATTGRRVCWPFAWMRLGRLDFSHIATAVAMWFAAEWLSRQLPRLYERL